MARLLGADYGREDLLALGSPLVGTLRAWGYEVIEAAQSLDVLQQSIATQGIPVLLLHEHVQQTRFTDMIAVDPRYRLAKSLRQFDPHELRRLLEKALP